MVHGAHLQQKQCLMHSKCQLAAKAVHEYTELQVESHCCNVSELAQEKSQGPAETGTEVHTGEPTFDTQKQHPEQLHELQARRPAYAPATNAGEELAGCQADQRREGAKHVLLYLGPDGHPADAPRIFESADPTAELPVVRRAVAACYTAVGLVGEVK